VICWTIVATPVDELRVATDGAAVTAIEFLPHRPPVGARDDDHPVLRQARVELAEYFCGDRQVFELPLAARGTSFQRAVWQALRAIPFGRTATYGEVARRIGLDPATTARAVGSANARNPIPVVVPCHRVIGADGSLTGFAGGLARKRVLLDLESALLF